MRKNYILFLSTILTLLSVSRAFAQDLRDPGFMERAQDGFTNIFNLDYDQARQVFASLEKDYPQHPAPPLYLASIYWLEEMLRRQDLTLNRFIAPAYFSKKTNQVIPPRNRTAFFQALQRCEARANTILKRNCRDRDARYFLGTAYGLRSSFAITIDHSLREAFSNGNRAYSYSRRLIEEDPTYYDAYLTVGVYEYIVGSIPWYLKWMAFVIGAHGSKQEGTAHLGLASEKGQYVRNEAKLVLMVLDVREHRHADALEIARFLNEKFPRSYLFPLNVAQILQISGSKDQAAAILLDVEKKAEEGIPNFDKLSLQTLRFNLGTNLMYMGKLDLAQEQFQQSINDPETQVREKALSHLRLGQILDWKGKRNEAVREYQAVLSLNDVENSHEKAEQLLNKLRSR